MTANDNKLTSSEVAAVVEGAGGTIEESAGAIFGAIDGVVNLVQRHVGRDILIDFVVAKLLDARYNALSAVLSSRGRDKVTADDTDCETAIGGTSVD